MSAALTEPREILLRLQNSGGDYRGRIIGVEIAHDEQTGRTFYLTADERVICYSAPDLAYSEWSEETLGNDFYRLLEQLPLDVKMSIFRALGIEPIVDL